MTAGIPYRDLHAEQIENDEKYAETADILDRILTGRARGNLEVGKVKLELKQNQLTLKVGERDWRYDLSLSDPVRMDQLSELLIYLYSGLQSQLQTPSSISTDSLIRLADLGNPTLNSTKSSIENYFLKSVPLPPAGGYFFEKAPVVIAPTVAAEPAAAAAPLDVPLNGARGRVMAFLVALGLFGSSASVVGFNALNELSPDKDVPAEVALKDKD